MATPENAEDKDVNEMVHKKRHPLRAASTYGKVSVISLECSGHHVDIILPLAMHSISVSTQTKSNSQLDATILFRIRVQTPDVISYPLVVRTIFPSDLNQEPRNILLLNTTHIPHLASARRSAGTCSREHRL